MFNQKKNRIEYLEEREKELEGHLNMWVEKFDKLNIKYKDLYRKYHQEIDQIENRIRDELTEYSRERYATLTKEKDDALLAAKVNARRCVKLEKEMGELRAEHLCEIERLNDAHEKACEEIRLEAAEV